MSHIIIGLGLAALAQIDPVVASDAMLSQAVTIGAAAGANAPDFGFFYKLKGNGSYSQNDRHWSHSLPALPLWGLAVSGAVYPFFPGISFLHLFIWTLFAVLIHVVLDLFNAYGTLAVPPFPSKWIACDSTRSFDPSIIILHAIGFSLISFFDTGKIFLFVYIAMFFYLFGRTYYAGMTKKLLQEHFHSAVQIKLTPRTSIFKWDVLIETETDYLFAVYCCRELSVEHTIPKITEFPALDSTAKMTPLRKVNHITG
ncbi:metal-dependent hydrolase [Bacillus sp. T33-2]|uniref:metal-dependent hydrolase n=1 Tax=Bacillus sp. T33-2 TaxID=2054168 RepID=UPI0021550339|nr:metal-dependent hydrolase [Bacillus sp. T33-2]